MHRLNRHAAEIPHGAIGIALSIGTRLVVELLEVLLLKVGMLFRRGVGERHQRLDAASDREVVVMDVDPGIGERAVSGDVVLMAVTVDHRIDRRLDPEIDHRDRRIDDHRLPRPLDQQRIARRVGTVVRGAEDGDVLGESAGMIAPGGEHAADISGTHYRRRHGHQPHCTRRQGP